ncbi:adaptin ear-binding coat-associated protein 1 [Endogone sp. FLAS-F59071]|nr:adaptin ear-binding coat-associated protein 1 [Endogone sp. FLAS-F59071]|eukprot:RUS17387.1 adaptin ear-binding coat-associated protein 1 [Endogone sp. FLAS-F59071]
MDDDYESVLLVIRECYVYRIPPRQSSRGYRAADWGDMEAFLWKGRLRIISKGDKCFIKLEDSGTGDLFALCPYDPTNNSVESVLDSSRYFVLKVEDHGRHAFIGMGFQERTEAFDFNVTLQDFIKQVRAEKQAAAAPPVEAGPKKDYSLKEGQTISITIGNRPTRPRPATNESGAGGASTGGMMPFLPPPPSAADVKRQQQQQQQRF